MNKISVFAASALLIGCTGPGLTPNDELVVDLIQATWSAEEYNSLCPNSKLDLPLNESDLVLAVKKKFGFDLVSDLASTNFMPGMSLKQHAQSIISGYVEHSGCQGDSIKSQLAGITSSLSYADTLGFINES